MCATFNIHMYVYMYVCMLVCVHVCMYVCMYRELSLQYLCRNISFVIYLLITVPVHPPYHKLTSLLVPKQDLLKKLLVHNLIISPIDVDVL